MIKFISAVLTLTILSCTSPPAPVILAIPSELGPAEVVVQGTQLLVRTRQSDGKLAPQIPYFIKGVCWSPATLQTIEDRTRRVDDFYLSADSDLPLMHQAHINTVYTFIDFGTDERAIQLLDKLYAQGIMVIPTVDLDGTNDLVRAEQIVTRYRNHPAILFWAIGNEWNINYYHQKFKTLLESAEATEEAAQLIKRLDPHHPVASIFGEIIIPYVSPTTAEIVNRIVPSVDIWGLNIYRGGTFGALFQQWRELTNKPMFLSEYGTDSFYTKKWWPAIGHEDEQMQASFLRGLIRELASHSSASNPAASCIGGTIFEWVDEWWKVTLKHGGKNERQDTGGFPTPWNKYSHPDSFANEEYFGILRLDRSPKAAYEVLQQEFAAATPTK